MAWSIIDASNLPPGDNLGNFQYFASPDSESSEYALQLDGNTLGQTPALSSFIGLQPWGFAGPRVFTPVVGTPVTDCADSGCGDGGGGTDRPISGFLYPRRQG
jgi:hypothetical protein